MRARNTPQRPTSSTTERSSRAISASAEYGTPLLLSADVLAAAPGLAQELQLAPPVTCLLRGRSQPTELYRLAVAAAQVTGKTQLSGADVRNQSVTLR